jgi:carbonic anhydrase/acetyltransferase-like protein (isoleucine patch superfamily)
VGLGAIVVVGARNQAFGPSALEGSGSQSRLAQHLSCVEVLGCSMLERTIERLLSAEVELVSVLVADELDTAPQLPAKLKLKTVKVEVVSDVVAATTRLFREYVQSGLDHSFVISANLYAETDLLDLFYFHREGRQKVTRTHDSQGPLELWVVDCAKAQYADAGDLLGPSSNGYSSNGRSSNDAASYFVREYVSRLAHPRELRRIACDALRGRCAMRPTGQEIRPGIWIEDGAEVHRRARVVAPAYIGRGTKVKEDTLITRCSTVERGCYVDAGTVIEDSSVLPNTHIGIWLDVCHGIASGNKLFSLERDVTVEISDSNVMRANGSARKEARNARALSLVNEKQQPVTAKVVDSKKETPAPEAWQLGANPIQG